MVLALLTGFFAAGWLALHFAHVPPHPDLTFAMFWAHWLVTVGACVPAILWSLSSPRRRFSLGLALSLFAIMSSYWGLTCIRIIQHTADERSGSVRFRFPVVFHGIGGIGYAGVRFRPFEAMEVAPCRLTCALNWSLRARPVCISEFTCAAPVSTVAKE